MFDCWQAISNLIEDPLLVFLLAFYALLGWIIFSLLRTISSQVEYERSLVRELNETSKTLVKLTTLIELLVHHSIGPNHD